MNEAAFRSRVVKALKPLHAIPVENAVYAGTPDINFALGWLELKVDSWRSDQTTALWHLRPEQSVWLTLRYKISQDTFLMLLIDEDWFLIPGSLAPQVKNKSRDWFIDHASKHWAKAPSDKELLEWFQDWHAS